MALHTLNIALADDDEDDRLLFKDAIEEIKIKTKLSLFTNGKELMDYLMLPKIILPEVIFLETFISGANIYINKPNSFGDLKSAIEKVLQLNWQYQTSALNRDNFLLRI